MHNQSHRSLVFQDVAVHHSWGVTRIGEFHFNIYRLHELEGWFGAVYSQVQIKIAARVFIHTHESVLIKPLKGIGGGAHGCACGCAYSAVAEQTRTMAQHQQFRITETELEIAEESCRASGHAIRAVHEAAGFRFIIQGNATNGSIQHASLLPRVANAQCVTNTVHGSPQTHAIYPCRWNGIAAGNLAQE